MAAQIAAEDARLSAAGDLFARNNRPLIHWTAGDGDDPTLLREAIFLTTTALGGAFDYAVSTRLIGAGQARSTLDLASQPVEWRALGEGESVPRLRPHAPEIVLPTNLAISHPPDWLHSWAGGAWPKHSSVEPPILALPPQPIGTPDAQEPPMLHFAPSDLESMLSLHEVPSRPQPDIVRRFAWLGGSGQWGVPGWSIADSLAELVVEHAAPFAGRSVLELGTSRGRLTAMMASLGCHVVTVDHHDRGARANLSGLSVEVIQDDLVRYLERTPVQFELIVCDLHGNSPEQWRQYRRPLLRVLARSGKLILNNAALHHMPDWRTESGVAWFLSLLPSRWDVELRIDVLPGLAIVTSR